MKTPRFRSLLEDPIERPPEHTRVRTFGEVARTLLQPWFLLVVAGLTATAGWMTNIINLIAMIGNEPITMMFVARVVGILFFPLGCVLGVVDWF